jgi:hypothetical protein
LEITVNRNTLSWGIARETSVPICTHLFVQCHFSQQVWSKVRAWTNAVFLIPNDNFLSSEDWWLQAR